MVWYPEGQEWAEDLVEECAAFPNGNNDDQVDVTVMAMQRFRQGNFIALETDDMEESVPPGLASPVEYY
jgi:phage terminase large subunit-like protein